MSQTDPTYVPAQGSRGVSPDLSENAFSGVIPVAQGSEVILRTNFAASIGFHMDPPAGGCVDFYGSWDGNHWSSCTFRQMGSDGYAKSCNGHEDWIGSVATFNFVKFVVRCGGSAPGEYYGRFSPMLAVLEGIEHGNEPHRIGSAVQSKSLECKTTSAKNVWTPEAGKKIVVTDINFTVSEATSVVYISEGSIADNRFIFQGQFKPGNDQSVFIPISFSLPYVFRGTSPLFITQTDGAQIYGVVQGYETEA